MYWGQAVNNGIYWGYAYTQSNFGSAYTSSWSGDTLLTDTI
jgi:hypothetical protein